MRRTEPLTLMRMLALLLVLLGSPHPSLAEGRDQGDGPLILRSTLKHDAFVHRVAASPDGKLLAGAGMMKLPTVIWDMGTGGIVQRFNVITFGGIVAFTTDGRYIITDPAIEYYGIGRIVIASVWDVATGTLVANLLSPPGQSGQKASKVAVDPSGRNVAIIWGGEDSVTIYRTDTWAIAETILGNREKREFIMDISFHDGGEIYAISLYNSKILLNNIITHEGKTINLEYSFAKIVRFIDQGRKLIAIIGSVTPQAEGVGIHEVKVWNVGSSSEPIISRNIGIGRAPVGAVAVEDKGLLFITENGGAPKVFSLESLELLQQLDIPGLGWSVAWLGECAAFPAKQSVQFWCLK